MNGTKKTTIRHTVEFVLVALAYIFLGKLGLSFSNIHPSVSAVFPATGLAIASLLIFGPRLWPAITLGSFLVNFWSLPMLFPSLGIALGDTLEAIAAVYLVRRFANGRAAFDQPKTVVLFILWAGVVASGIGALFGVSSLAVFRMVSHANIWIAMITWWLGHMSGAVIATPLIILWTREPKVKLDPLRTGEFALLMVSVLSISALVYSSMLPFPYLFFLPVLWSAFRFDLRETMTIIFFIAIISVRATALGAGPFATAALNMNQALWFLQLFLMALTLSKLTVACTVVDRRHAYEELTLRERFFKALIEKNTDAVCLIDRYGIISYVSPSSYYVLGYKPEEAIGKSSIGFIHTTEQDTAKKLLLELIEKPSEPIDHIYRMQTKDGTYKWIETIGRNLLHDDAVHAIVINFRDVTERQSLEEAKNEFFAIAAHQLRSPLTSIRWYLESVLVEKSSYSNELREKLDRIYGSSQMMIRTVNEILDVTRIIEGKLTANPEPTNLSSLVAAELKEYSPLAIAGGNTLTFNDDPGIPAVMIDPVLGKVVLENILSNAIKYTKNGTITISLSHTDTLVTVEIRDTGVGIPKEEQKELFTKFYRTKEARAIDAQGAGLGLFIVQSYVYSWGGSVELISPTIGTTGTTVTFTIPVKPNA